MASFTPILRQAFNRYKLNINNEEILTPYRINLPYQDDRRKYGKSDPLTLKSDLKKIAQENNFDLKNSDSEQIRQFMISQKLGIDCSGLVYHLLDYLLKKVRRGGMEQIDYPKASRTNVKKLLSKKFTLRVRSYKQVQPADLVGEISGPEPGQQHIYLVLDKNKKVIILVHSSPRNDPQGIGIIKLSKKDFLYHQPKFVCKRLKILFDFVESEN